MKMDASDSTAETSAESGGVRRHLPAWIKVGTVAAASALAGGLAAAWFYRKTLSRLQNAEVQPENSNFRISEAEDDE